MAEAQENPLQHSWTFWEHRKGGDHEYGNNMHNLGDFNTVEGFWRFYNNIPKPSTVFTTSTETHKFADRVVEGFGLFKTGIRPEWEDKANMHGGEFFCRKHFSPQDLDETYENMVLGLVGESIDPNDEITGVRIVDKSKGDRVLYRIELWFRSQDHDVLNVLKRRLAECVGHEDISEYRTHGQAMYGGRGSQKSGKISCAVFMTIHSCSS